MDASRHLNMKTEVGITALGAGRMSLANDLRDLADEIERGTRLVREMNIPKLFDKKSICLLKFQTARFAAMNSVP